MAKVTNKLQVTVPKPLAVQLGIRPGDDVDWAIRGHSLQVTPAKHRRPSSVNRLRDLDP
ncbi:MAG: AbrB/MazE/SpoVT family DNA-binding domain-containing protein [Acidobacteria bacterium]|nr:AbrB/MazE/SpoVT family DNA-binding domain-containing protein [Acidobacteriota bacterium]